MLVINFFGEPGSGKSTASAGIFYLLVTEFAKDLVYDENTKVLSCQNFVFANQEYRISRLKNKVDIVITDSPILLSAIYAPDSYPESFKKFCLDMFNQYNNINFFIKRNHIYSDVGRLQTEDEAKEIGQRILKFMGESGVACFPLVAGDDIPNSIYYKFIDK